MTDTRMKMMTAIMSLVSHNLTHLLCKCVQWGCKPISEQKGNWRQGEEGKWVLNNVENQQQTSLIKASHANRTT